MADEDYDADHGCCEPIEEEEFHRAAAGKINQASFLTPDDVALTDDRYDPVPKELVSVFTEYTSYLQMSWALELYASVFEIDTAATCQVTILSGDAGAGKSTALKILDDMMTESGCSVLLSVLATTNTAAECSDLEVRTVHSAMLINTPDLLRDDIECDKGSFVANYWTRSRSDLLAEVKERRQLYANAPTHKCPRIRLRCPRCAKYMKLHVRDIPVPAYSALLVIDEYGMMSAQLFDIVHSLISAWVPENDMPTLVLCGAVTQLPPYGIVQLGQKPRIDTRKRTVRGGGAAIARLPMVKHGLFDSALLKKLLSYTFKLPFSVRGVTDPEYFQCLSFMQFNRITPLGVDILRRRCQLTPQQAMCPAVMPETVRIVHKHDERTRFTQSAHARLDAMGVECYNVSPVFVSVTKKCMDALKGRYRNVDLGMKYLYRGQLLSLCYKTHYAHVPGAVARVVDYDPIEEALTVTSLADGNRYTIKKVTFRDEGSSVTFMPLLDGHAVNTCATQGSTYKHRIIYIPPKAYHLSPIKASAYVVLSRVTDRNLLVTSGSSYLQNAYGNIGHFSPSCVRFHIESEEGYKLLSDGVP